MQFLDLILLALAANAIMTAWFYGSIFEKLRKAVEMRGGLLGELLNCVLCSSYHAALWTVVLLWLPGVFLPEPWRLLTRIPLIAFAVTTAVHYMQSVLPVAQAGDDSNGDESSNSAQNN